MPKATSASASSNALTLTAYPGDGAVLLAFSLDESELKSHDLAGFAIQYTTPAGQTQYLQNRLNYSTAVTSSTTPAQRPWTSSQDAPFQKLHWVHFPPDVSPGRFKYKVTARYCQGAGLADGPSAEVPVELAPAQAGNFELGLTRGYISSQAYVDKFHNADIRPGKTLDYDTSKYQAQYQWLGYHARKMIFTLLQECVNDKSITVDFFGYDLDEPDIIKMLEDLGPRLRAFLDNASLHTKPGALEIIAHSRLVASAGAANVKQGHFSRFAHDKIIIQKKNGKAVKVLTGSANFSVRGLYVQANNVLLFNDPQIAGQYEQVFQSVFDNMSGYVRTPLAAKWFPFPNAGGGIPNFQVSFAPHPTPPFSTVTVDQALQQAKSSVMFAVMELQGGGPVLAALQNLHNGGKLFSYGMTQSLKGFTVYKPDQPGVLVPFAVLAKQVPPPFNAEFTGGPGQVIHDKFIVIDFNDKNPIVFTGSSNLADGGEVSNGDNLLQISDPHVAQVFAVEAVRLVDHYYFRAAMQSATNANPLVLSPCGASNQPKWWQRDYDPNSLRNVQRELFAGGPSAITSVPSGGSGVAPSPAPAPAKKKGAGKNKGAGGASKAKPQPNSKSKTSPKSKPKSTRKTKPRPKATPRAKKSAKKKSAPKKKGGGSRVPRRKP
jgi:phosphatidylserine/phosphatidylglycerophosphate/cardiolipin synthase-like enzyme